MKEQRDRLVDMRMGHEIERDDFLSRDTKLRDDQARLKLLIDAAERSAEENTDVAIKAFELSQRLRDQWVNADYAAKRRILEIMWLNCQLEGVNLAYEMRKPFDVLAEGLSTVQSCGGRI